MNRRKQTIENRRAYDAEFRKGNYSTGWRAAAGLDKRGPDPVPPGSAVERDPCPRCGVRRDFGCRHRQSTLLSAFSA